MRYQDLTLPQHTHKQVSKMKKTPEARDLAMTHRRQEVSPYLGHPRIARFRADPRLLSEYIQLLFNVIIAAIGVYVIVGFIRLTSRDVDRKLHQNTLETLARIERCRANYERNRCEPANRAPRMEQQCQEWLLCLNQDTQVAHDSSHSATIWAATLAEIIDVFLKNISVRSLVFMLISICGIIVVTNVAFGSYRVHYYGHAVGRSKTD
ncbi:LAMI_0D01662g1_1 [Lachancea mirantina]|uniref:LAMI_0D01662g1_1 n=1 Tax=Lachancea mirantina TaxID=1230905 RepID=A0A1G4J8S7_9SACH|nr:LAMI_0D01662g1_1 [Lachancea mirantina]